MSKIKILILSLYFFSTIGLAQTTTYIRHGINASPQQFPFFVGYSNLEGYLCGGSLITEELVLTAAHCVKNNTSPLVAHIGMTAKNPLSTYENIPVQQIIIHPTFSFKTNTGDIAVLKLARPATASQTVRLASNLFPEITPNDQLIVMGIGLDENNNSVNNLRYQYAHILDWESQCANFPAPYPPSHFNPNLHLCTTYTANGGDSGSPVITEKNGHYYQVGIVSRSFLNADQHTKIAHYQQWIESIIHSL